MRNTHIDRYDNLDRPVVAIGNDYPPGGLLPAHAHRRAFCGTFCRCLIS